MKAWLAGLAVAVALGAAAPALAQQVEIEAPAPPPRVREPVVIPPGDHYQATRPSDADYYPRAPAVRPDPTFIGPFSRKTETGRAGLAGWTAPATPVGSPQAGHREVPGWFVLGFAVEWGGPPPPAPTPTRR